MILALSNTAKVWILVGPTMLVVVGILLYGFRKKSKQVEPPVDIERVYFDPRPFLEQFAHPRDGQTWPLTFVIKTMAKELLAMKAREQFRDMGVRKPEFGVQREYTVPQENRCKNFGPHSHFGCQLAKGHQGPHYNYTLGEAWEGDPPRYWKCQHV